MVLKLASTENFPLLVLETCSWIFKCAENWHFEKLSLKEDTKSG